jgi:hypothetical protein
MAEEKWLDVGPVEELRHKKPHEPHPLARPVRREPGPVRVAGISTTVMDRANPRYSGSEELLAHAIAYAGRTLGAETRLIRLGELALLPHGRTHELHPEPGHHPRPRPDP